VAGRGLERAIRWQRGGPLAGRYAWMVGLSRVGGYASFGRNQYAKAWRRRSSPVETRSIRSSGTGWSSGLGAGHGFANDPAQLFHDGLHRVGQRRDVLSPSEWCVSR